MIANFFKERWPDGGQGEEVQVLQGGAGQAAVQGVNQLNQAQCGRGAQTDCYLNREYQFTGFRAGQGRGSASAGILGHEVPLLVVNQAAERGAPVSQLSS